MNLTVTLVVPDCVQEEDMDDFEQKIGAVVQRMREHYKTDKIKAVIAKDIDIEVAKETTNLMLGMRGLKLVPMCKPNPQTMKMFVSLPEYDACLVVYKEYKTK